MKTKKIRRFLGTFLCTLLCIGLLPTAVFAADSTLTVNGVNALETSSGDGWKYDSTSNTLTLNGYNGGSIIASHMDLNIVLAEGSENIISTSEEYGIAYSQPSFSGTIYDLRITGKKNSSLNITSKNHAVFSKGDLFIENLNLTAKNTTTSNATTDMECIFAERNITIDGSTLNVTAQTGVGITCFDVHTIRKSTVTVNAGMLGIHANNKNLTIEDTTLNINAGTGALYSYFGGVYLARCNGDLTANTAAIYANNVKGDSKTELTDCELKLTAPYGVMTYSSIMVNGGNLNFDSANMGIYAYSKNYDAVAQFMGSCVVTCTTRTPQLMQVNGSYKANDTAEVTGVILENTGNSNTMRILLVGDIVLSSDTKYSRNILIPEGASVTVPADIAFDLSTAPSVIIEGTLINKGTLTLNGSVASNKGSIYNYGQINLLDNNPIENTGKIYSLCTNNFDLKPYGENGILLHAELAHTEAAAATHLTEGNTEYWYCDDCKEYFSDEAGTKEISLESTVIPKLPDHTADNTGWHSDETNHWNTCECGEKLNKAAHTFKWVVDKKATADEAGLKHEKCTVCGYEKAAVEIPATGTDSPNTGDNSHLFMWIMLALLGGGSALTMTVKGKKKMN